MLHEIQCFGTPRPTYTGPLGPFNTAVVGPWAEPTPHASDSTSGQGGLYLAMYVVRAPSVIYTEPQYTAVASIVSSISFSIIRL